jgi:2-dehydro-3-deoxygluconokinase
MGDGIDKQVVAFGEIMLRLSARSGMRLLQDTSLRAEWAGSEANVLVALAHLGFPVQFVTAMPEGVLGNRCIAELHSHGVGCDWVLRSQDRMGLFYYEHGSMMRPSKVIYDRSESAFARAHTESYDWEMILAKSNWLHLSGITIALSAYARASAVKAAAIAKSLNIPVSIDLNYRSSLWKNPAEVISVMNEILSLSNYVIGNEEDFRLMITGEEIQIGKSVKEQAEQFLHTAMLTYETFPNLQRVFSSIRIARSAEYNNWAGICAEPDGAITCSETYHLNSIVDRVGTGDAFAAGVIYGLINELSINDGVMFAAAAGAIMHTISGDFFGVTIEEIRAYMHADGSSSRIQR